MKKPNMKTLSIQLTILVVLLLCVEGAARVIEVSTKREADVTLNLLVRPYTMFQMPKGGGHVWKDIFTNQDVPSTLEFNNEGYAETFDYSPFPDEAYLAKHAKQANEKLVFVTGASVVHGVGATAMDKTIPKQMEKYLNEHSKGQRYRVLNMAMGSWTAYQQFIGLSLYGRSLNPDWIVVMDGHNDGALACSYSVGAGNPMGWPKILFRIYGGSLGANPVDAMAKYSATVRLLAGRPKNKPKPPGQLAFHKEYIDQPYSVMLKGVDFSVQDKQLNFYLQAQRNVISLFNHSNVLLTLQPLMYDNALSPLYRRSTAPNANNADAVAMDGEMKRYMKAHRYDVCGPNLAPQALAYFMNRSHVELADLAKVEQQKDPNRKILYANTEWTMPLAEEERKPFFIDNAHMSDKGQQRVAEYFGEIILAAENSKKFNYAAFVKSRKE